jgi:hypothetical protein
MGASIATTIAWLPSAAARRTRSIVDRRGVDRHRRPGVQCAWMSLGPHAAADVSVKILGGRATTSSMIARFSCDAPMSRNDLVGPGLVVAARDLDRIPRVAQAHEAHALDDAAVFHVEAGDDSLRQHDPAHTGRRGVGPTFPAVGEGPERDRNLHREAGRRGGRSGRRPPGRKSEADSSPDPWPPRLRLPLILSLSRSFSIARSEFSKSTESPSSPMPSTGSASPRFAGSSSGFS